MSRAPGLLRAWEGASRQASGRILLPAFSTFPPSAGPMERARDNGLLIGKDGLYGNVLRLSPMLNISKADADEGVRLLDISFSEAR